MVGSRFGADRRAQLGIQDLDGHWAVMLQVFREKDRGHPAAPHLALEAVAAGQG